MKKLIGAAVVIAALNVSASWADEKKDAKKTEGHCEKIEGGKEVDLAVPADVQDAKKWCKEQGGKWQKGKHG